MRLKSMVASAGLSLFLFWQMNGAVNFHTLIFVSASVLLARLCPRAVLITFASVIGVFALIPTLSNRILEIAGRLTCY